MKSPLTNTRAYFDCNATTPVLPLAAKAALDAMESLYGNPSSSHLVGLQAKHLLESTRRLAAQVLSSDPKQVIFTSGATEAIQTAVFSALQDWLKNSSESELKRKQRKLLYGATEHKAVPQSLHHWVSMLNLPLEVVKLPVNSKGQIDLEFLRQQLPEAVLLCTMAVNNETGVIQNLSAIENILLELKASTLWLVDCVQALGKVPLNFSSSRINYSAFSGHKLYAPKGIGFLYVSKEAPLFPLIVGGGQESGLRSGTENLPGVAALGAVLEQLVLKPQQNTKTNTPELKTNFCTHDQLLEYRNKIILELQKAFPKIEFNSPFDQSVATTINFSVPGLSSGELLDLFDSAGLRLSAGSACSSNSVTPSHVLDAMGIPEWRSKSAIRLSFGPLTTESEINRGCQIIRESAIALQNTCLIDAPGNFEAPENLRDGIIQFRSGSSNSWLIVDRLSKRCIIVDPCGPIADRLVHYVQCQNLEVIAVLDTHSHGDHQSIRPELQRILSSKLRNAGNQFDSLGWPEVSPFLEKVQLENGSQVEALIIKHLIEGDLVLARAKTPGHTDDSHAYLFGLATEGKLKAAQVRFALTGDTVLSGGLGRTNFSVSDPTSLFESLRILNAVLLPTTLLCPAHDYNNSFATTLGTEELKNSLLALALGPKTPLSLSSFIQLKSEIDLELVKLEETFQGVVCGVTPNSKSSCEANFGIEPKELQNFLAGISNFAIVDIREPQEFLLFKDWTSLGFHHQPKNIPLSRFVNFMYELTHDLQSQPEKTIILLCRTGTRSLQAAKSLRNLGLKQVWSVTGGISNADLYQPST